jgi:hypothetical protein
MSWAETDQDALEGWRDLKGTLADEDYTEDVHDPTEIGELGSGISDLKWKMMGAISSDPAAHVRKIKP